MCLVSREASDLAVSDSRELEIQAFVNHHVVLGIKVITLSEQKGALIAMPHLQLRYWIGFTIFIVKKWFEHQRNTSFTVLTGLGNVRFC